MDIARDTFYFLRNDGEDVFVGKCQYRAKKEGIIMMSEPELRRLYKKWYKANIRLNEILVTTGLIE
jgi:hypothetical protein